ncbi:MAG TPA: glycosyltransferase family 2 protein [Candidatus Polarisedimenticolia bacterium]|nr:glycosyltransferase family 2 protein [Candidatus Polarisedimenticolia bacterium]
MKLIIQIPCLNEETTLPVTLASLPRALPGVDRIEVLVIDDGSTDGTVETARRLGVHHVVVLSSHQGLARAFMVGLEASLKQGADIIVNTDADNQYDARDVERLIAPILEGRADLVVGDRDVQTIGHFSRMKKLLHRLGDRIMQSMAGIELMDSTSGFRAYSREAALRLNIFSRFTYTLETLIQAGKKNLAVAHVRVGVNEKLRESRLFPNLWFYLKRSASTMVRIYALYEPLKVFSYLGAIVGGVGLVILVRFVYHYFTSTGPAGHLQSLLVGTTLLAVGVFIGLIGVVSDVMAANRQLLEDVQYRLRKMEADRGEIASGTGTSPAASFAAPGRKR